MRQIDGVVLGQLVDDEPEDSPRTSLPGIPESRSARVLYRRSGGAYLRPPPLTGYMGLTLSP